MSVLLPLIVAGLGAPLFAFVVSRLRGEERMQPLRTAAAAQEELSDILVRSELLGSSAHGWVDLQVPSFMVLDLLKCVRQLVRFGEPTDLPFSLADSFRSEPMAWARLILLLTLTREFPECPATRTLLLEAREDRSDEVALRAAIALGDEGAATLRALVGRHDAADPCRARAVSALGEQLAPAEAAATLRSALGSQQMLTAAACVERLARPDSSAQEPLLLETLRDTDDRVRLAAVRALGAIGSVQAVLALRELSAAGNELRSAVRRAIAKIQSRLAVEGPGQLSLAGGEAGALSLAEDAQGELSLADAEREGTTPTDAPSLPPRPLEETKA
jgi:hypothetical protein